MKQPRQEGVGGFNLGPSASKWVPQHAFHTIGRSLRLVSVYAAHQYLITQGVSIPLFLSVCLLGSAALFCILQRPWRGRPLPSSQLVPALINGGVMAGSLLLWANGLRTCGPVRTILGEYAGAVLGVISTLLFSRSGLVWRRVGGLLAMLAAYYCLSQGWAMSSFSPFFDVCYLILNKREVKFGTTTDVFDEALESAKGQEQAGHIGPSSMLIPALSGILAALRRIISRRVSLKSQSKKRLHAVTVTAAACFLFPFAILHLALRKEQPQAVPHGSAAWAYISTILFGIVLIFYVDTFVEDRLHIVMASPKHLLVTGGGIIVLELLYGKDFSLLGFLICASVLGLGIFEATTTDKGYREPERGRDFLKEDPPSLTMSPLPS